MYRNRRRDGAATDADHGAAFAIGHISNIVPSLDNPDRWVIKFDRFAQLNGVPDWSGDRNPVIYCDELIEIGIDAASLEWNDFRVNVSNDPTQQQKSALTQLKPLTITESLIQKFLHNIKFLPADE